MSSATLPLRPGLVRGPHPEHAPESLSRFARLFDVGLGLATLPHSVGRLRVAAFAKALLPDLRRIEALSEQDFDVEVESLRAALLREGLTTRLMRRSFVLIRDAARRSLGTPHYAVQIYGGWIMARGGLAELATGEGKTLTATLPAALAGLAGIPVHVITANDYLVERDAEAMRPIYERLGLRVGTVLEALPDEAQRREAYACDVTYVTNKQVAFDYLRDRVTQGDPHGSRLRRSARTPSLLRGLCFAVVDEADSVLIDDAGTPLVLSRPGAAVDEATVFGALDLAAGLEQGPDYRVDRRHGEVELSDAGRDRLAELGEGREGPLASPRWREQWVQRALHAEHVLERDRHYVVRDGGIEIIDLPTGRRAPDRAFEGGIHSLLEARLGLELTPARETVARITYQSFFRRYLRLGGMTGTAREVAQEMWRVYALSTVTVPTRRPLRRKNLGRRVFAAESEKLEAAVERVRTLHEEGRPVLVGTGSVGSSEAVSAALEAAGLVHRRLDAHHDAEEAAVIAEAGERGRITVATQMAGRGTDIQVEEEVEALGGLAVIAVDLAEAQRIDRQLYGRCGRQGGAGSHEQLLSVEDPLLRTHLRWGRRFAPASTGPVGPFGRVLTRWAQMAEERRSVLVRRRLVEAEKKLDDLLAFSNRRE